MPLEVKNLSLDQDDQQNNHSETVPDSRDGGENYDKSNNHNRQKGPVRRKFRSKARSNEEKRPASCDEQDRNFVPPTDTNVDEGMDTQKDNEHLKFYLRDIKRKNIEELRDLAESLSIEGVGNLPKHDLVFVTLKSLADKGASIIGEGVLEILQDGYGFLRSSVANYTPRPDDIYVSQHQIKRFMLRTGDTVTGPIRPPQKAVERYFALKNIDTINSFPAVKSSYRMHFDDLTPLHPDKRLVLETTPNEISTRIIDIISPIGRGQRALIVAPPRTGKTVLMQSIAHSITNNYPDIYLIVLLIDERPEEVTDMARSVRGEVVSSTFDEPSSRHVLLAEIVIEKAKRLVEAKKDVVILLDSITRLARAYNNVAPSSGKVLSGGIDSNALQRPKRFFGAARNTEEGGSLTIIATALTETGGSRMDEVIFEEFKGTGNSEIVLDRKIADRRVFPAIDISRSGTRKDDLLLDKATLDKTWVLRKVLNPMQPVEAVELLIDKLKNSKSNEDFFERMNTYNSPKPRNGV